MHSIAVRFSFIKALISSHPISLLRVEPVFSSMNAHRNCTIWKDRAVVYHNLNLFKVLPLLKWFKTPAVALVPFIFRQVLLLL